MAVYQNFKNLNPAELQQEEYRFNAEISNLQPVDQAWAEPAPLFDGSPDFKQEYRFSYWRWFVILSWQKLSMASPEMVLLMMKEQVPMAIVADVDVLNILLRHLAQNFYYRDDLGSFYKKLRAEFLESDMVFGEWQGQGQEIKDVVTEYVLLKKREAESIEMAEFYYKIQQILFPKEFLPYVYIDVDIGVERFVELINFFQDVDDEKKIREVLEISLLPKVSTSNSEEKSSNKNVLADKKDEIKVLRPQQTPAVMQSQKQLTMGQIKSKIESEFKKDKDGNFENIEGVLARLAEMSEEYNKPEISEMMYFDEQQNRFVWKQ